MVNYKLKLILVTANGKYMTCMHLKKCFLLYCSTKYSGSHQSRHQRATKIWAYINRVAIFKWGSLNKKMT